MAGGLTEGQFSEDIDLGGAGGGTVSQEIVNITDRVSYTPVFTGFGTVVTESFSWARHGDMLHVSGKFTVATPTAVTAKISLPLGLSIDDTKYPSDGQIVGRISKSSFVDENHFSAVYDGADETVINVGVYSSVSVGPFSQVQGSSYFAATNVVEVTFEVPIDGWTAKTEETINPTLQQIYNTTGFTSFTPTTQGLGTITSPNFLWKRSGGNLEMIGTFTTGTVVASEIQIGFPTEASGGVSSLMSSRALIGNWGNANASADDFHPNAISGDTFFNLSRTIIAASDGSAILNNTELQTFHVKIPIEGWAETSDNVVLPVENVRPISYNTAAAQSIPNNVDTAIDFGTKIFDDNNLVTDAATDWRYTAPSNGKYRINAMATFNMLGLDIGEQVLLLLYKNGSVFKSFDSKEMMTSDATGAAVFISVHGTMLVDLLATDYVDIRVHQNSGAAKTLFNNSDFNYVSITKDDKNVNFTTMPLDLFNAEEWVAYDNGGSWLTNTTYDLKYKRVGENIEIEGRVNVVGGNPTASSLTINLPVGLTFDTAKIVSTGGNALIKGLCSITEGGVGLDSMGRTAYNNSTTFYLKTDDKATVNATSPITFDDTDFIDFNFTAPILGWKDKDTNIIVPTENIQPISYNTAAGQSISTATTTIVDYDNKAYDSETPSNVTTGASWKYTASKKGKYSVNASVYFQIVGLDVTEQVELYLYKNGTIAKTLGSYEAPSSDGTGNQISVGVGGTADIELAIGDYVDIRVYQNSGGSEVLQANAIYNFVDIKKIDKNIDFAALPLEGSVSFAATIDSAVSLTAASPLVYDDVERDTHSAYNNGTGVYTVPKSGWYIVSASYLTDSQSWVVGNSIHVTIQQNGTSIKSGLLKVDASITDGKYLQESVAKFFTKNDTIEVDTSTSQTSSTETNAIYNRFSITKIDAANDIENTDQAPNAMIRLDTGNGHGSTNTAIRRFTNVTQTVGTNIVYADSATLGATFTIKEKGVYAISYSDGRDGNDTLLGISKNSTELTTSVGNITVADRLAIGGNEVTNKFDNLSWIGHLNLDDVIRAHTDGGADKTTQVTFTITQISKLP